MAVTQIPTEFIYDIEQRRPMLGQTPGVGFLQGQFQGAGPYGQMPSMIDPTFKSGFEYAKSIAGGMPMEQVIAPGVSYSPDMPMGYTQAQLNTPVGTTPVVDDQTFKGDVVDSVTIPQESKIKMPPVDRLGFLTGLPPVNQQDIPTIDILDKISGLFNIPTNIPGRDFSVDQMPDLPMPEMQNAGLFTTGVPQIQTENTAPIMTPNIDMIANQLTTPIQDPIVLPPVVPPTLPPVVPPISTPPMMPPSLPTGGRFSVQRLGPGLFV